MVRGVETRLGVAFAGLNWKRGRPPLLELGRLTVPVETRRGAGWVL